jgi:hypothetical protein
MQVTFRCPHCDVTSRSSFEFGASPVACTECGGECGIAKESAETGSLEQCVICPSTELYIRKDFSQKLGVAIVVAGFVLSSIAWYYRQPMLTYGILFATAAIDVVLYATVGNMLQCYRCHAQYREIAKLESHEPFSLETHEKYRQQEIRLAQFEAARNDEQLTPRP